MQDDVQAFQPAYSKTSNLHLSIRKTRNFVICNSFQVLFKGLDGVRLGEEHGGQNCNNKNMKIEKNRKIEKNFSKRDFVAFGTANNLCGKIMFSCVFNPMPRQLLVQ